MITAAIHSALIMLAVITAMYFIMKACRKDCKLLIFFILVPLLSTAQCKYNQPVFKTETMLETQVVVLQQDWHCRPEIVRVVDTTKLKPVIKNKVMEVITPGRITADNVEVSPHEAVWEIVYRYINPETSWAEAEQKESRKVPDEFPVWKYPGNCLTKCMEINKKNYPGIK